MTDRLHLFTITPAPKVRHTDLTRQRGEAPALPPLAEWLGLDALDTDRIELFPLSDLGVLQIGEYLVSAHDADPDAVAAEAEALRGIDGAVLIVPDRAMTGAPEATPPARAIAVLPVPAPVGAAHLPPANSTGETAPPPPGPAPTGRKPARHLVVVAALVLAVLIVWLAT
ncbi:MAG: hypothetical protein AAF914_15440 [Pseudomonadota bacterium]